MKALTSTISNHGTMDGESAAMSIDVANMEHLMGVLTNLYGDRITAVIREYSTNGFDAQTEAGVTKPIRVTLPTKLNPTFVVEDFGVGMSTDELLRLYSQYGSSTKRDTNEQTGMLGIGSKSGLALSSQFTVRSRKGGVETSVLVFLNDLGSGEIKVVDTRACDSTGTQISIPVSPADISSFTQKATNFFRFWRHDTIEGVNIDRQKWEWISDTIALAPRGTVKGNPDHWRTESSVVFVQGNVPYVFDPEKANDHLRNVISHLPTNEKDVVFYCPIGSLQFVPSREDLYYTRHTAKEIERCVDAYKTEIKAFVEREVDKAPTKKDAITICQKWQNFIKGVTISYRGEIVPSSIPANCYKLETRKNCAFTLTTHIPSMDTLRHVELCVYGVPSGQFDKTAYQLRIAVARYLGQQGLAEYYSWNTNATVGKHFIAFADDLPENFDWLGIKAIHWDTLVDKKARVKGQGQAKSEYQDRTWGSITNGTKTRAKVTNSDGAGVITAAVHRRWDTFGPAVIGSHQIVFVPENQIARFHREFPKAETWDDAEKRFAAVQNPTAAYAFYAEMDSSWASFDASKILDKRLARVVQLIHDGQSEAKVLSKSQKDHSPFATQSLAPKISDKDQAEIDYVISQYWEVVKYFSTTNPLALEIVNALYTYRKAQK